MKELTSSGKKIKCVATIGAFDGLHRGHIYLLKKLKKVSSLYNLPSLVITFWPDPEEILNKNFLGYLTTLKEKKKIISSLGIDYLWILKISPAFLKLEGENFLKKIFKRVEIKTLVVGEDFSFGYKAKTKIAELLKLSHQWKFKLIVIKKRKREGIPVSSSLIRKLIKKAEFDKVKKFLGREFIWEFEVTSGLGLGKRLGFPTLNLKNCGYVLPENGVYAVKIINKKKYLGVCNIGFKPTIKRSKNLSIEVHILNWKGKWHRRKIKLSFLGKIREEKKFSTLEELKKAIEKDIQFVLTRFRV